MASLHACLLTLALAAPADVVLLDFYSPHCGPCRQMEPVVQRLLAGGYPVRKVQVEQQRELAGQFGVRAVPSYVLLINGREVDRVEGATSYERLQGMFARAGVRGADTAPGYSAAAARAGSASPPTGYRGQSPDQVAARPNPDMPANQPVYPASGRGAPSHAAANPAPAHQAGANPMSSGPVPASIQAAAQHALQATVRLRVEDAEGQSWGTGTIIDTHGDEALVLTCGHLFRESGGKGKISVELFAPGASGAVPGELIDYDASERDIAVVSIRPNVPVKPVRVGSAGARSFRGDRVFSIGCNHGQDPTIRHSHVTAINKYIGPANIEVAGQPVDGRSGGGLFAADGSLIGVCNAADPQDDEGIYAALETIHWQLAQVGQERIFSPNGKPAQVSEPPVAQTYAGNDERSLPPLTGLPSRPDRPASASANGAVHGIAGGAVHQAGAGTGAEVFCIIRTPEHPQGKLIVVDQPELIQQLLHASRKSAETNQGGTVTAARQAGGPIIRAQSADNHPAYR